ncbi:MAG: hypothetical protein ACMUEM_06880 [Flavobacteriales bacterium AspAUS03]
MEQNDAYNLLHKEIDNQISKTLKERLNIFLDEQETLQKQLKENERRISSTLEKNDSKNLSERNKKRQPTQEFRKQLNPFLGKQETLKKS